MYLLLLSCFLCFFVPVHAFSIKDKIFQGNPGDFIVMEQSKTYSLLVIRSRSPTSLILEEIGTSVLQSNWKEWINTGAPGFTARFTHILNKTKGSDAFLIQLLSLPLIQTSREERKKIGPAPQNGEPDQRPLWNPPLIIEGKKRTTATFEVFKTTWPKDDSQASGCPISIYFDAKRPNFPFPYWIEIKSPHYALNIRAIDSGRL